jgi:uncharacterized membrane protein YhaH (DUF805 family)
MRSKHWLYAGLLLLVVNSGYLSAFGAPSLYYIGNVVLYPLLGILLLFPALALLKRLWRDSTRSGWVWAAAVALTLATFTGIALIGAGNFGL